VADSILAITLNRTPSAGQFASNTAIRVADNILPVVFFAAAKAGDKVDGQVVGRRLDERVQI